MLQEKDLVLGQLAIARGLISLATLIRCTAGLAERSLSEALVSDGLLERAQLQELTDALEQTAPEALREELAQGQTLIVSSLHGSSRAVAELSAIPTLFPDEVLDSTDDEMPVFSTQGSMRYMMQRKLGQGGMGEVWLAHDRNLSRDVALKFLREDVRAEHKLRNKLLLEAQVTGMLEHPSIVPVYDLGHHHDRGAFYAMRVVREQSLDVLLEELRDEKPARYTLGQMVGFLRQALLALQYAHDHGVIHRDLKPENLLIGAYGEVLVIDWGIAKIAEDGPQSMRFSSVLPPSSLVGTPRYMAPEQARGDNHLIDGRTDVYAMGAILYEVLTLEPVFAADNVLTLLFKVSEEAPRPPSLRAPDRKIPAPLEEICLRALNKDPDQRYQSAQHMARELEQYLEGIKDQERRLQIARDLFEQADRLKREYLRARKDYARSVIAFIDTRAQIPSWAPIAEREKLWALEQRADDLRLHFERTFGEAIRTYSQALGYAPQMEAAREALAELYWQRFQLAEASGDDASAIYFEGLVRQYNDGKYDTLLAGLALISVSSLPEPERVQIYRYEAGMQRLLPKQAHVYSGPISKLQLPHGSYLVLIERKGFVPLRVPVKLERLDEVELSLRLRVNDEVPKDMIIISAGEYLGGQIDPVDLDRHRLTVGEFAIGRFPITCAEYLLFLNDLAEQGRFDQALSHAPRVGDTTPPYFEVRAQRFFLPEADAEGDSWSPDWPICLINCHDAEAYAAWRSEREGRKYRLPTAQEWEKAARGVDGRLYPWGNTFDPAFCCMRDSHKGRPMPANVGAYPYDCSPYGVMDMAGNMVEWTSSWSNESKQTRILQGASFNSLEFVCRLDWTYSSPPSYRYGHYGFRLALEIT